MNSGSLSISLSRRPRSFSRRRHGDGCWARHCRKAAVIPFVAVMALSTGTVLAQTAPATAPSDRIVTPDGWFPRPKVDRPVLPAKVATAYVIPIHEEISPSMAESVQRKIVLARGRGAKLVIFDMNTLGGRGDAMDAIIRMILQDLKDVTTVAYVNPEAISAGADIAIACNEIVMCPTGKIGDSMPIWLTPTGQIIEMPEKERGKFESYMLAQMRMLAGLRGYDKDLLEGMITITRVVWLIRHRRTGQLDVVEASEWYGRVAGVPVGMRPPTATAPGVHVQPAEAEWEYVETIVGPDKLVTLTTAEALRYGLITRTSPSLEALWTSLGAEGAPKVLSDSGVERVAAWLTSLGVTIVLLILGIVFGYIEFHTPGFGVPGILSIICFVVLFASRYLTGLAQEWEIILFVVGVLLLVVEVFVTPGFGVIGVEGIACCLVGLLAMAVHNAPDKLPWPDTDLAWRLFERGIVGLVGATIGAMILAALISRYLPSIPLANRLILRPAAAAETAPVEASSPMLRVAVGDEGVVSSPCRPVGKVRFGEDYLDAASAGEMIPTGTKVRVIHRDGNRLIVERTTA